MIPLLIGRRPQGSVSLSSNSSTIATAPYGLRTERGAAIDLASTAGTEFTFACWINRSTLPASKYVLARMETTDASSYVEISIASRKRISVTVVEEGLPTAVFYSSTDSVPSDGFWHHVCVTIDTNTTQEERRAIVAVDSYERAMFATNPMSYGAVVSSIENNRRAYVLGTETESMQFPGAAAHAYLVFGRALDAGYFTRQPGASLLPRDFPAAVGASDIYLPLTASFTDAWNSNAFSEV